MDIFSYISMIILIYFWKIPWTALTPVQTLLAGDVRFAVQGSPRFSNKNSWIFWCSRWLIGTARWPPIALHAFLPRPRRYQYWSSCKSDLQIKNFEIWKIKESHRYGENLLKTLAKSILFHHNFSILYSRRIHMCLLLGIDHLCRHIFL